MRQEIRRYHNGWFTNKDSWRPLRIYPRDPLVSLVHFFSGKSKATGLGTTLQKCRIIRISELSNIGLKVFCCICVLMYYLTKITQTCIYRQRLYQLHWSYMGMSNTMFYNRLLSVKRVFMKIALEADVFLRRLTAAQLLKKFPTLYVPELLWKLKINTTLPKDHHSNKFWSTWIQSTPSHLLNKF